MRYISVTGGFDMTIERNEPIHFHEKGTLEAVTRWIATHHDGIAEWVKNVRRQYQVDRANVAENHRVAALLVFPSPTCPAHCGAPLRLAKVSHWLRVNPRSGFIRHRSMLMSSWRKPCGTSNL